MNNKKVSIIEKKLNAIEWKLELLKTSATTTHTPLRTLKSMIQSDVVSPTQERLKEFADSSTLKEKLANALRY